MQKIIVHYTNPIEGEELNVEKEVEVTLGAATKKDGIQRSAIMTEAVSGGQTPESLVMFYQYATCICAVKSPQWVRDMPFDFFLNNVSEKDIDEWTEKAYEENPQWKAAMQKLGEMTAEQEKKTGQPLNG